MPIPTHSDNCYTKIVPTKCPDCSKSVYFFNCSHGSKVYFDIPEPPWKPHKDSCPHYLLKYLVKIEQVPPSQIRQKIISYSKKVGMVVPKDILQKLDQLDTGTTIVEIPAVENGYYVRGKVFEVTIGFDFFYAFGFNRDALGYSSLGNLSKTYFNEIVIRMETDKFNSCKQYRTYVSQSLYDVHSIGRDAKIRVKLNPYRIPDRKTIWIIQTIEKSYQNSQT